MSVKMVRDWFLLPLAASSTLLGCAQESLSGAPIAVEAQESALFRNACERRGLSLAPIGTYASGIFDEGAAEIVAHDPASQRLFVVNAAQARIDVLDILDPTAPTLVTSIDLTSFGASVNSVAVREGIVAAAVEASVSTDPGAAVFLDASTLKVLSAVEVGALPDMVAFSPNGRFALVANEGEPSSDYTIDPEGSVSIINLTRGVARVRQSDVRTADFRAFEGAGLPAGVRVFGPGASVAQDLEPEFVTISEDSRTAWVTLQENNALAVIDIARAKVTKLLPLGTKDHRLPGQGIDASDRDNAINIANWPVEGIYQPDSIASYTVLDRTFLVLANEGDLREYDTFVEGARVSALPLDPTVFPDAATLQSSANLGRLTVSTAQGDVDNDGDFDALFVAGGRSFSIRAADGELLFDSGDDFERITAQAVPENFNASNTNNTFDNRSDDKGPEPEGLAVGNIAGRTYAFIGLERVGGVMMYDITRPRAPCFSAYVNNRNFSAAPESAEAGDLGPEGLLFVRASDSPNGRPLLITGNEISGTTTIYQIIRGEQ